MSLPRLAAALAGLVLPVLLATTADAAPRHHTPPAHVVTTVGNPASVQFVARHRHHRRHYAHRAIRRHG